MSKKLLGIIWNRFQEFQFQSKSEFVKKRLISLQIFWTQNGNHTWISYAAYPGGQVLPYSWFLGKLFGFFSHLPGGIQEQIVLTKRSLYQGGNWRWHLSWGSHAHLIEKEYVPYSRAFQWGTVWPCIKRVLKNAIVKVVESFTFIK